MSNDLRVGLRSLRQTPVFTATAILTLALGIGLSTAVFTIANALLFRGLPFPDAQRVVLVAAATPDGRIANYPFSADEARDFLRATRALSSAALVTYEGAVATPVVEDGRISLMRRALVSGNFFRTLGATPLLGRALGPDDDLEGAAPVAVLSHRAWVNRYGGAPDVVGKRITTHLTGETYTIVGVMPPGLDFPRTTDVWLPAHATGPGSQYMALNVVGRMAAGASMAAVAGEMTTFLHRPTADSREKQMRATVTPLSDIVLGDTRVAVIAFIAACVLLLLITCTNVANLLLVRGVARVREMAVRSALGASRLRLTAQLLTEYAILAIVGGVLGVGVAVGGVRLFIGFAPASLPQLDAVRVDGMALLGGMLITLVALLVCGVVPSLTISGTDAQEALRSGSRRTSSRRARRFAEGLVAAQVAIAMTVLAAAALVGRSFMNLQRADLAIDASHLLVADLGLRVSEYGSAAKQVAMLEQLLPTIRALPGVEAVSPVVAAPFSGAGGWSGTPSAEGQTPDEAANNPLLNMDVVAPEYFSAMGMPVVRGRAFTNEDDAGAAPVVMLSSSAARSYWGDADPIGKRLLMKGLRNEAMTVIGIVSDTRYRDLRDPQPSIYFPLKQSAFPFAPLSLVIRTRGDPSALVPALRQTLTAQMPGVVLSTASPFSALLAGPLAQPRLNAVLLAVFAISAGLLAAIGLFGVLATTVQQRRRELGIRMTLGATPSDVRRAVLMRGVRIGAIGAALGLGLAGVTNRNLGALVYGIAPGDLPTLLAVALGLIAVSALASYLPARSSSRVDPAVVLRAE